MSKPVYDEYNTVMGPVEAVRVTRENIRDVARWCGGEVKEYAILDTPEPELYIALTASNTHLKVVDEKADIGEWVVEVVDDEPRRFVYADKLFLGRIRDAPRLNLTAAARLIREAMAYQEQITSRGGTLQEGYSVADFAAMQIEKLFE